MTDKKPPYEQIKAAISDLMAAHKSPVLLTTTIVNRLYGNEKTSLSAHHRWTYVTLQKMQQEKIVDGFNVGGSSSRCVWWLTSRLS